MHNCGNVLVPSGLSAERAQPAAGAESRVRPQLRVEALRSTRTSRPAKLSSSHKRLTQDAQSEIFCTSSTASTTWRCESEDIWRTRAHCSSSHVADWSVAGVGRDIVRWGVDGTENLPDRRRFPDLPWPEDHLHEATRLPEAGQDLTVDRAFEHLEILSMLNNSVFQDNYLISLSYVESNEAPFSSRL